MAGETMGRRRRRWREPPIVWWTVLAGIGVAAWLQWSWRLGLIMLLAWCLYELAFVPALCRVTTRQGFSCRSPVRGRLFACAWPHQQVKNDAMWRLVGLRNPFRKSDEDGASRDTGVVVYSPLVRGRLGQADRIMLVLTALGTVVAIAGTIWGLVIL